MPPADSTATASTNGHSPGRLEAIDPPPARRRPGPFSAGDLEAAAAVLRSGQYVSDRRGFASRSGAAHRADALKRALSRAPYDFDPARLRRRTWYLPNRRRYGWAVHLEKGKGRAR